MSYNIDFISVLENQLYNDAVNTAKLQYWRSSMVKASSTLDNINTNIASANVGLYSIQTSLDASSTRLRDFNIYAKIAQLESDITPDLPEDIKSAKIKAAQVAANSVSAETATFQSIEAQLLTLKQNIVALTQGKTSAESAISSLQALYPNETMVATTTQPTEDVYLVNTLKSSIMTNPQSDLNKAFYASHPEIPQIYYDSVAQILFSLFVRKGVAGVTLLKTSNATRPVNQLYWRGMPSSGGESYILHVFETIYDAFVKYRIKDLSTVAEAADSVGYQSATNSAGALKFASCFCYALDIEHYTLSDYEIVSPLRKWRQSENLLTFAKLAFGTAAIIPAFLFRKKYTNNDLIGTTTVMTCATTAAWFATNAILNPYKHYLQLVNTDGTLIL